MSTLKVVADKHIPLLTELLKDKVELLQLDSNDITPETIKTADALLLRSVTKVNSSLLDKSSISFVGTATSGFDHLDTNYLNQQHITWCNAPGCNALSVADYVMACVKVLRDKQILTPQTNVAAVIGIGNVGKLVSAALQKNAFKVLENDPPRAEQEKDFVSSDLEQCLQADLICLHTPLTKDTKHLFNANLIKKIKPGAVLLNAGRGAVIDEHALEQYGQTLYLVLDVWENEPNINLNLAKQACIATPHIAGHAIQSKWRGAEMIATALLNHFNLGSPNTIELSIPKNITPYNPLEDQLRLLDCNGDIAQHFQCLRKHYPARYLPT